ncbi:hydantoinase/oxoprolinase family protein [Rhodococcus marinonascens]|uniref:hydantoinase/oxoprolinase family protein n=1 Tax=Rhodococcus marinonascens TaxID=38311 RepID=UPI000933A672|nr:hydantoinase/oxoprolinase family protein [Rhodococcus marinonascens]
MNRIGIDVGGTFTDVVILDEESGLARCFKAATDYLRPAEGIMAAFDAADVDGADVSHVKLGTTLAVNAILTRRGASTGLLTTAGFRDVLEIRRTHRERLFDLYETIPAPLVPRHLRKEVDERVDSSGKIITEIDEDGVRAAWRELREQGVTAIGISFLFSFRNPANELRVREIILEEGGAEAVFCSSEVLPVLREYERTSTTVAAAFVAPVVRNFVSRLSAELEQRGVSSSRLSVMTNSGGALGARAAAGSPIPILLSGPAGGVSAARWLAAQAGKPDVVTLDMGGTSCDVSGVQGGVPDERLDMSVGGLDIVYPTLDLHTIGAGGGSIAWLDTGGALRVGPVSAGSAPGPACYGRGGTQPTVTDANLVLGRYDEGTPLGGHLNLDLAAAREAIEHQIAQPMGISIEKAATGIVRLVNAAMVNAVRTISVQRGRDPRWYALAPFGGGGPVHALDIADQLGITTVVVPPFPGCTSAFGAILAAPRRDTLRSINRPLAGLDVALVGMTVADLVREVSGLLAGEGYDRSLVDLALWASLHYAGQAHELVVRHGGLQVSAESLSALATAFGAAHERQYGHHFDDVAVELVTLRVTGIAHQPNPNVSWEWAEVDCSNDGQTRQVYFESIDRFTETRVVGRGGLVVGERLPGPAVLHQEDATTLVPPGWLALRDTGGCLLITKEEP